MTRPQTGQCGVPGAREQHAQVVVDLGDRADGRPRVAVGRLLVDRHRRRQALDEVDVGLVHLPEELPGVRRQRLDVAALALGEDRVEGQARLARPGQPGEHDQRVAREVEGDVLEVVLARAAHDQAVGHGVLGSGREGSSVGCWRGDRAPGPQANVGPRQRRFPEECCDLHRRGRAGRARGRPRGPGTAHHQGLHAAVHEQLLPAALHRDRRHAARRRGRGRAAAARAGRRRPAGRRRRDARPLGPPAGAGGGRGRDRRARAGAPGDAADLPVPGRPGLLDDGDTVAGRPGDGCTVGPPASGHTPGSRGPGLQGRPGAAARVLRRQPVPGRRRATPRRTRRGSRRCSTTSSASCSTGCRTRPGSTRGTATDTTLGAERPALPEWRARGW